MAWILAFVGLEQCTGCCRLGESQPPVKQQAPAQLRPDLRSQPDQSDNRESNRDREPKPKSARSQLPGELTQSERDRAERVQRFFENEMIRLNIRRIGVSAEQYFIQFENQSWYKTEILASDLISTAPGRFLPSMPTPVAGEDYEALFPITKDFTVLTVTKADGETIEYRNSGGSITQP